MTSAPGEPDAFEKRVRFGCGSVFGCVLGFYVAMRIAGDIGGPACAVGLVSAIVCGVLAVRFGDSFWMAILTYLRQWP